MVTLNCKESMFTNQFKKFLVNLVIKRDSKHNFEVSCSNTNMRENIRIISAINKHDTLNILWNLFFSVNLFTEKHSSSMVDLVHDIFQMLNMLNITPTSMRTTLADNMPIS